MYCSKLDVLLFSHFVVYIFYSLNLLIQLVKQGNEHIFSPRPKTPKNIGKEAPLSILIYTCIGNFDGFELFRAVYSVTSITVSHLVVFACDV